MYYIYYNNTRSVTISAIGIGYSSLGAALFKLQKLIHAQILPVLFSTGTILETHSTYQQGQMNPVSSSHSPSSLIRSWIIGLNL
jgi:hypothetical protein